MPFIAFINDVEHHFDEAQLPLDVQAFLSSLKPSSGKVDALPNTYTLQSSQGIVHRFTITEIAASVGKLEHVKVLSQKRMKQYKDLQKCITALTIKSNTEKIIKESLAPFSAAAANGHAHIVEYLSHFIARPEVSVSAGKKNLLSEIYSAQYAKEIHCAVLGAMKKTHINVMRQLCRTHGSELNYDELLQLALEHHCNISIFKLLLTYTNKYQLTLPSMKRFLKNITRLDLTQHLLTYRKFRGVMVSNFEEIISYLVSKMVDSWGEKKNSFVEIIKYLLNYGLAFHETLSRPLKLEQMIIAIISSNRLDILKPLLQYESVKAAIQANSVSITDEELTIATRDCSPEMVGYIIDEVHPDLFRHLARHTREYGDVSFFVYKKLETLNQRKSDIEAQNPNAIFNITPQEARACFLMIEWLILQNDASLLDQIRYLLDIPAIKNIAATEDNILLQTAVTIGNQNAINLLLAIPSVRVIAAQNNFYTGLASGQFNLRAMAQNAESSMIALSVAEQERLQAAIGRYMPMIKQKGGVSVVFESFRQKLRERYLANPAKIEINGVVCTLPLTWTAFEALALTQEDRARALEAYYQHTDHTALRYLSKPNQWMHLQAQYVCVNPNNTQERWASFEEHISLITMLYEAAIDPDMPPYDGYTLETRLDNFIKDISLIGRAHNWDRRRPTATNPRLTEEYDDLEPDRPTCHGGTKRRLFQAVRGHGLLEKLTRDKIAMELRQIAVLHVKSQIQDDNRERIAKQFEQYVLEGAEEKEFMHLISMPLKQQEAIIQYLRKKYGDQFKGFEKDLKNIIERATHKNTGTMNVLILGAGTDWYAIFGMQPPPPPAPGNSSLTEPNGALPTTAPLATPITPPSMSSQQMIISFLGNLGRFEYLIKELENEVLKLSDPHESNIGFDLIYLLREKQQELCFNNTPPAVQSRALTYCVSAVKTAQVEFEKSHKRSLVNILANIGLFIVSLGIGYLGIATIHYFCTGRFTFFDKPACATQLPKLTNELINLQSPSEEADPLPEFRQFSTFSF